MRKVLVVDDNELVGKLVSYHLGKYGCDVMTCHSPFGVLEKVKDFCPDIILLDLKMPWLSGRSVAGLLRKSDRGIRCKTIIFSSEEEQLQKQMVDDDLADAYFVKNHSFDGLKETIDRVVEENS